MSNKCQNAKPHALIHFQSELENVRLFLGTKVLREIE